MSTKCKAMIFVLLILVLPIVLADPMVFCIGCDKDRTSRITTNGIDKWQTFYVKDGRGITLEGSSGFWKDENEQRISDESSLAFTVKNSASYILETVNGNFCATINMIPLSSKLPKKVSGIYVDGDETENHEKIRVAQGSSLKLKLLVTKGDCPAYFINWTSDSSAITFSDSDLLSTVAYISNHSGKNPTITATVYSENRKERQTRDIELIVFKNTPPKIELDWKPNPVKSHEFFNVYFDESTSGSSGDESNDYIAKVSASLQNPVGATTTRSKTMDEGDALKSLSFTAGERGRYYLTATITDSYGATDTTIAEILVTEKGGSGRDKPLFHVREPVNCIAGKNCPIEVYGMDSGIFLEYYYQNIKLVKPFKFSAGDHWVEIRAFEVDDRGKRKNEIKQVVRVHAVADDFNAFNDSSGSVFVAESIGDTPIARVAREKSIESQETSMSNGVLLVIVALWVCRRRRLKPKS